MVSRWKSVCLSIRRSPSLFSVSDDNLRKLQWFFTKRYIDIVEIWFGIANVQISSNSDRAICLRNDNGRVLLFYVFNFDFIILILSSHLQAK